MAIYKTKVYPNAEILKNLKKRNWIKLSKCKYRIKCKRIILKDWITKVRNWGWTNSQTRLFSWLLLSSCSASYSSESTFTFLFLPLFFWSLWGVSVLDVLFVGDPRFLSLPACFPLVDPMLEALSDSGNFLGLPLFLFTSPSVKLSGKWKF